MPNKEESRIINVRKLVSNAKAILTNQIGFPLGIRKMVRIQAWIRPSLSEIDLGVFRECDLAFGGCPIGSERLLWEKNALKIQDEIIEKVLANYKGRIIDKCFEIIELLDEKSEKCIGSGSVNLL